ncbi:prolipoprotein diacylglyceryl transferase [Porticoccus sp. GXU_MW_L64]
MTYPNIDPVALDLGFVKIHWYGVMYLLAFASAWLLARYRSRLPWTVVKPKDVEDLIVYIAFGVIVGGRLGSALFYNFGLWLDDPLWIFRIWEGGMAFHGGLVGVIVALWRFSRRIKKPFIATAEFIVPMVPLGLAFGRLGNFIGGELWGRETAGWWGMVFPKDQYQLLRHPSQLYEMFLEGILLFAILFWVSRKPRPAGLIGGLFLFLYGLFRYLVEFVREPDVGIPLLFDWMTRGQQLCVPMMVVGVVLIIWAWRKNAAVGQPKHNK